MIGVIWLVMGAMMGSVANAVIYRLPKNISWVKGRSICPKCKHELAFGDLIPLVSYIMLRGKCRYCHKPIGIRYFAVELVMAIGFLLIFKVQGSRFNDILLMGVWWVTVVIAVMDWETKLVSEAMVGVWAGLVVAMQLIPHPYPSPNLGEGILVSAIGVVAGVGLIGGIWAISKGKAMGFGDVEIAAVLGIWLGWPRIMVGLWAAFVIGAAVGLVMIGKHKAGLKSQIAFGPFLVLGGWIGAIWGGKILQILQIL